MKVKLKLIVVLAQGSRHIVETCGRKQRCISPAERPHVDRCCGKGHAAHLVSH